MNPRAKQKEKRNLDNPEIDIDASTNNGQQDRGDSEHPYLISSTRKFVRIARVHHVCYRPVACIEHFKNHGRRLYEEEEIRHHYETKYKQYESQITLANSKAKEVYSKYKDSVEKLKQLAAERRNI